MFFPHCATRFCPYDDSPFPFFMALGIRLETLEIRTENQS